MFLRWDSEEEPSSLDNALHGLYSDGAGTAGYIKENISPGELMVSVNVSMAATVQAYLPGYHFYFAGNGRLETYADWSQGQERQISLDGLLTWARSNFPEKSEFYVLDSGGSCLTDGDGLADYEALYRTPQETARGEEYTVYRVRLER